MQQTPGRGRHAAPFFECPGHAAPRACLGNPLGIGRRLTPPTELGSVVPATSPLQAHLSLSTQRWQFLRPLITQALLLGSDLPGAEKKQAQNPVILGGAPSHPRVLYSNFL